MGASKRKPDSGIPEDLVMEIVVRLPGKQVGRCKCVCKSWRSIITSAHFKDVYGRRHRGMILYRRQPHTKNGSNFLNIYYSTISGKQEEFSPLCTLSINDSLRYASKTTQVVNGILCVYFLYQNTEWLSIYNVCTGERMWIRDLPHNARENPPEFHLGYDPLSRRYKLLRLTSRHAHIMTLRPSSSSSTWELINVNIGISLHRILQTRDVFESRKMKISPNDGLLCWGLPEKHLTLFDFSKEKFQKIGLPNGFRFSLFYCNECFVRAQFMEHLQRLAVSLWSFSKMRCTQPRRLHCFVMDDDEGKRWTDHFVEFPTELDQDKVVFVVSNGNLSTASATELVLVNTAENDVYCYNDNTSKMEGQFRVGKPPEYPNKEESFLRMNPDYYLSNFPSTLSCLYDSNRLYLPLDDILSASK